MEISSNKWLSEMDMLDDSTSFFYQPETNNNKFDPFGYLFDDISFESLTNSSNHNEDIKSVRPREFENDHHRPLKQIKVDKCNWKSSPASSSCIISFDNASPRKQNINPTTTTTTTPTTTIRSGSHAQEHVLAERKRREKLSQRFIALSALLPNLKKTDKASILGDATKYLKQLQDRVNVLEKQVEKKKVESAIYVRKSQVCIDEATSSTSSGENFVDGGERRSLNIEQLPEIEARVSDKDVLVRVHCESKKGCVSYLLGQIEGLNLNVVSSNLVMFGKSIIDVTVLAKMEDNFSMTTKDIVKKIRTDLSRFI